MVDSPRIPISSGIDPKKALKKKGTEQNEGKRRKEPSGGGCHRRQGDLSYDIIRTYHSLRDEQGLVIFIAIKCSKKRQINVSLS